MRIWSTAAWLLLIPALLLTAFLAVAGNGSLYGALQDQYVDAASTGVSDEERYRINECLAEYIRGGREDIGVAAFNEREILHMKDVQALFDLARNVRWVLALGGGALLAIPAVRRRQAVWQGYLAALGLWLAALLATGVWAVTDFTRAFLWFHEVLFSNDMWLLNPATDLMIRMLPEAFFADIAAIAVIAMAVALAVVGAGVCFFCGKSRKRG